MWLDYMEKAQCVKTFYYRTMHTRTSTMEEALNNQVGKMTQPMDSHPSATVDLICWAHEWSGRGGRDGGYIWAQSLSGRMDCHLPRLPLNVQPVSNRDQH